MDEQRIDGDTAENLEKAIATLQVDNTFAIFHSKLTRPPETGFFKKTRFLQPLKKKALGAIATARCERAQKPGFAGIIRFLQPLKKKRFGAIATARCERAQKPGFLILSTRAKLIT